MRLAKKEDKDMVLDENEAGAIEELDNDNSEDENLSAEDAEAIFSEAAGVEEAPAKKTASEENKNIDAADKNIKDPAAQDDSTDPNPPAAQDDKTNPARPSKNPDENPSRESLEKALKDTQVWASQIAKELAEIKKNQKILPPAAKAPEPEPEIPAELKEFYADYPEFKNAVQFEAERLMKSRLGDLDPQSVSALKEQVNQFNFEKMVVTGFADETGTWVDGHPDAYKVMAQPDFKTWIADEMQRNPSVASISNPKDAIAVLNKYKSEKASIAAAAHDNNKKQAADQMNEFASGGAAPGNKLTQQSRKSEESPEEIFDKHAT